MREIVEEGAQATVDLINEFNAINEKFAEPMDDDAMQALIDRQAVVQDKLDAIDAWNLDSRPGNGHGRPALSAGGDAMRVLSGGEKRRRVAYAVSC